MSSGNVNMPKRLSRARFATSIAILSALSILFEIIPSFRVFWGMKIDFVGTVWVLAFFLFGLTEALCISVITTTFIIIYSPTGLVGAIMKFIATVPMFLIPALLLYSPFFSEKTSKTLSKASVISVMGVLAIFIRVGVCSVVNYYWAIPLWLGKPSDIVLKEFFGGSILAFIVWVASMNVFQGIIDILVPWFLAFKIKLTRYFGTW